MGIEGLTRAPAFNGRRGVIQSLDEEIGRYTILLSSPGSSGGRQWAKVKRENLRLAAAPPPAFAPSLVLEDCSAPNGHLYDMPETPVWCKTHMACELMHVEVQDVDCMHERCANSCRLHDTSAATLKVCA